MDLIIWGNIDISALGTAPPAYDKDYPRETGKQPTEGTGEEQVSGSMPGTPQMVTAQIGQVVETVEAAAAPPAAPVVDPATWGGAVVDLRYGRVYQNPGAIQGPAAGFSLPVSEVCWDKKFLEKQMMPQVRTRLPDTCAKLGPLRSPAMSRAAALASALKDWHKGLENSNFTSLVVRSEGMLPVPILNCPYYLHLFFPPILLPSISQTEPIFLTRMGEQGRAPSWLTLLIFPIP